MARVTGSGEARGADLSGTAATMASRTGARGVVRPLVWLLLAVVIAACALGSPGGNSGPRRLPGQITDDVGALDGRTDEVKAALRQLQDDTGLQLFVVYVRSFGGYNGPDWAHQTAVASGLGDRDGILAVATEDRDFGYEIDNSIPLTQDQARQVAATAIEPALRDNDWAAAAIGAANGYRAALAGQPIPTPRIVPGDPHPGKGSADLDLAVFVLLALIVLAAIVVWVWVARRRRKARAAHLAADPNDAFPGVSTEQLTNRANTLLLQVDDAQRTSERELGLATAEFGEQETAPFSAAVARAKAEVAEAFRIRMELDDLRPDDEIGRRQRLAEIIRHGEAADKKLDEQAGAFRELRDLATNLEQTIPALSTRRAELAARVPEVSGELDRLRAEFAGPTLAAVAGNIEQVDQRLRFATATLAQAGQDAAAGRRPKAALQVRAADQALDQCDELLAAVTKAGADLRAAKESIPALLAEVSGEVEAARAAQPSTSELANAASAGEQAISDVRAAQAQSTMDPLAELRRLREADAALDKALESFRTAQERAAKARAMIGAALAAARAQVSAANDFINTRRGAVGTQARTLLAEAQRLLAQAEAHEQDDPATALDEAQKADRTAEQAIQAAQFDVDSWGGPRGGYRGGASDALLGAVLGGILVGGGRRGWGGGWGGPGRIGGGGFGGGGFGGFGGGGGFGGSSPGGFGGSSGGGRF